MKKIILLASLILVGVAEACPNFSGEYFFKDHPWNGKIIVSQNGCDSISFKHIRPVDASPANPNGKWEFTTNYRPDGLAYEGMYQSKTLAQPTDHTYHITSFVNQGVSIVDYQGSQSQCGLTHTFNDPSGECKKSEMRLEFNTDLNKYVWRQIGNMWWPNGWNDDSLPLEKR